MKGLTKMETVDQVLVRLLATDGIPIRTRPFDELALRWSQSLLELGLRDTPMTEAETLAKVRQWVEEGTIRRLGARVRHQRAGYAANGMTCWAPAPEMADALGERLAQETSVSHCYRRPPFDGFPYGLYAMMHGREKGEIEALCERIHAEFPDIPHMVLWTTKEYKKSVQRYFEEESR